MRRAEEKAVVGRLSLALIGRPGEYCWAATYLHWQGLSVTSAILRELCAKALNAEIAKKGRKDPEELDH